MQAIDYRWKGADGVELFGKEWSVAQPKAVVILVHGMGEHCERYTPLAQFLNQHNIALASYDQRGHGKTAGKRGHTPSVQKLYEDLDIFIDNIKAKYPNIPLFLYGHSMGGNVVLNYTIKYQPKLNGVIATGPWIRLAMEPPKALIAIGKMLRGILPGVQQDTKLDPYQISTIEAEVEKYKNDPLNHGKITFAMAIDTTKAAEFLDQYSGSFPTPLLIMHGAEDAITSPEASQDFANRITSDITYKAWPGNYHEIHNDVNRQEVFEEILNWMKKKM